MCIYYKDQNSLRYSSGDVSSPYMIQLGLEFCKLYKGFMERLLTQENINELSELMLLILSAFFHDIGMAPHEKEVLL